MPLSIFIKWSRDPFHVFPVLSVLYQEEWWGTVHCLFCGAHHWAHCSEVSFWFCLGVYEWDVNWFKSRWSWPRPARKGYLGRKNWPMCVFYLGDTRPTVEYAKCGAVCGWLSVRKLLVLKWERFYGYRLNPENSNQKLRIKTESTVLHYQLFSPMVYR